MPVRRTRKLGKLKGYKVYRGASGRVVRRAAVHRVTGRKFCARRLVREGEYSRVHCKSCKRAAGKPRYFVVDKRTRVLTARQRRQSWQSSRTCCSLR
jgi:hypothetical protein